LLICFAVASGTYADSVLPPLATGDDVLESITRLPPSEEQSPFNRLPPVIPPGSVLSSHQPERVALLPPSADDSSFFSSPRDPGRAYDPLDEQILKEDAPAVPPGFKNGVLQFTTFRKTFLLQGSRETGMGIQSLLLQTVFAVPLFTRDKPIFITPYFQANILQGPVQTDLPPQLYDVSLEFRILRQPTPQWGVDLAFAPTILSDFQNMSHQAYRWVGRAAALYTYSPMLQIAGGAMATGRTDVPVLPIGGLIWTPTPDWRHEIIFPKPKLARRLTDSVNADWWAYAAGEFGGNSYAIERAWGANDIATYRDLRFILGLERKTVSGVYHRFEAGYVFDRLISYQSGTPSYAPTPTVMLRGEAVY
jgi:hypothetical protein